MAIKACRECGGQVSSKAASCPHCGAKQDTGPGCLGATVAIVGFVVVFGWALNAITGRGRSTAPRVSDEQCKTDLKCWAERNLTDATVACRRPIEDKATWQMEWTDSMTKPRFSRYAWADQATGVLRYYGDAARFQNGFGAWQNVVYACDISPTTGQVVTVRVEPGRL